MIYSRARYAPCIQHGRRNLSPLEGFNKAIEKELTELEPRNLAHAVATSERLSQQIDPSDVAEQNTADVNREWRDKRYGENSS